MVVPNRLFAVYRRSQQMVSELFQKVSTCKSDLDLEECDPIPSMTQARTVICLNGFGAGEGEDDKPDPTKAFIHQYVGHLQRLGFAGFMGACSAIALKRISREVAAAIGVTFAGLQALSYYGYIHINYDKVSSEAKKVLDVNGDGKLDEKDVYSLWDKMNDILGYNLPSAGSFSVGFLLGLRLG